MEAGFQIINRIAGRQSGRAVTDAQGVPVPGHNTMEVDANVGVGHAKKDMSASQGTLKSAAQAISGAVHTMTAGVGETPMSSAARAASSMNPVVTNTFGIPWGDNTHSYNAGGVIAVNDVHLIEQQQLFNRAKIVERQVHACGSGAFGVFKVTADVSHLTKAAFLQPGKETPIVGRFSTVTYGREYPDSARNPRGLAFKFYTEEGNYDVLSINFPAFFCRDPALGPSNIRSQSRNPNNFQVNLDATFDWASLVPESTLANLWFWSDFGHPVGWRYMDGFPCHTFKWVNAEGAQTWVRYAFKTTAGLRNWAFDEAVQMCGVDPDFAKRDMWQHINDGGVAEWKFCIQLMSLEEAEKQIIDPFDATKEWPEDQFPSKEIGTLTFDRNPENFHRDIEQVAFSPGRLVPGIEISPDLLLSFRAMWYQDTQLYRLGPNYHQIPVNCPFMAKAYHPLTRDGVTRVDTNGGMEAAYYPNSFKVPPQPHPDFSKRETPLLIRGAPQFARTKTPQSNEGTDNEYIQGTNFYQRNLDDKGRQHLHYNIARGFAVVSRDEVKVRFLMQCYKVDPQLVLGVLAETEKLGKSTPGVTYERVEQNVQKYNHTVDQAAGYIPYPLL